LLEEKKWSRGEKELCGSAFMDCKRKEIGVWEKRKNNNRVDSTLEDNRARGLHGRKRRGLRS